MTFIMSTKRVGIATVLLLAATLALAQPQPATSAQRLRRQFDEVNHQILEMAQGFPESRYAFRPTSQMRSFGEVIVHVMSGNVYGAKAGRGQKGSWYELDPKSYRTKADIVAAFQKSIADCDATLKDYPEGAAFGNEGIEGQRRSFETWMSITEDANEQYRLLLAYYRASGPAPPASRPKSK